MRTDAFKTLNYSENSANVAGIKTACEATYAPSTGSWSISNWSYVTSKINYRTNENGSLEQFQVETPGTSKTDRYSACYAVKNATSSIGTVMPFLSDTAHLKKAMRKKLLLPEEEGRIQCQRNDCWGYQISP